MLAFWQKASPHSFDGKYQLFTCQGKLSNLNVTMNGKFDYQNINLEAVSLHTLIFVGQLKHWNSSSRAVSSGAGLAAKAAVVSQQSGGNQMDGSNNPAPTAQGGETKDGIANLSLNEVWEKSVKDIGEENAELLVTGLFLFYPNHIMAYCESSEHGLQKCLQKLNVMLSIDASKLLSVKIVNIQHNIKERLFGGIISKIFDPPTSIDNQMVTTGIKPSDVKSTKLSNSKQEQKAKQQSFDNRIKLLTYLFGLIKFIRRQTGLSTKKALDLVGEKMSGLLPDAGLLDRIIDDDLIPDAQTMLERQFVSSGGGHSHDTASSATGILNAKSSI